MSKEIVCYNRKKSNGVKDNDLMFMWFYWFGISLGALFTLFLSSIDNRSMHRWTEVMLGTLIGLVLYGVVWIKYREKD